MDVIRILEKLSEIGYIRLNKISHSYYSIYCPFHNNGNERKPSFGVLLKEEYRNGQKYPEGWCHCFTCGYAHTLPEMVGDILKSKNISTSGQDWLVKNIPGFEINPDFEYLVPENLMSSISNKFAIDYILRQTQPEQTFVSEEELSKYRYTVPYMYQRGLTDEIIEKFDVGVDMNWIPPGRKKAVPCLTFPVRDIQGRALFICRRSIEGKMFNLPENITKPLYGVDMIPKECKSIVICESIINTLTCWKWGYPSVAILGTGNSYQIQQLRELGVSEYVICMDGDEAGKRATNKLKKALKSNAIIWTMHMIDGKDVNDIDKQTFDRLYEERD